MAFFQSKTTWVQPLGDDAAVVTLDPPGKVTALDLAVMCDLEAALDAVGREDRFRLVCVRSAKSNSFAQGLEASAWSSMPVDEADALCAAGQRVCRRIVGLGKTTVAWIQGLCLGGGLELALACDWRVSAGIGGSSFGFAFMELGLMPAWGGIHHLPHVVGLDRALQMLLGGKRLSAKEALAWKLVDAVAESQAPDLATLDGLRSPRGRGRWPRRTWKQFAFELLPWSRRLLLRGAERTLHRRLAEGFDAPREVFESFRFGLSGTLEASLERDRGAFGRLVRSDAFRNLCRLRELRERHKPEGPTEPRFRRVAVIGASDLGMELVEWLVARNFPILLREPDESTLGWSFYRVLQHFEDQIRKGTLASAEMARRLDFIRSTSGWKHFGEVDLVLDVASQGASSSPEFFAEAARHVRPDAILAGLWPGAGPARLQDVVPHPERIACVHFISSATAKFPLLEIVGSERTSERTLRRLHEWSGQIGKAAIRLNERPGGLFWRVWFPAWNEALTMLREGFRIDEIDAALMRFGMAQGPLEQIDLLGIDIAVGIGAALEPAFAGRIRFDPAWALFAERKWRGTASGTGFWRLGRRGRRSENAYLVNILRSQGPLPGDVIPNVPRQERRKHIQERLVGLTVLEAMRCLDEKVAADGDAIDFALMMAGWAPHRGGPLAFARHEGESWKQRMHVLAQTLGPRYAPPDVAGPSSAGPS